MSFDQLKLEWRIHFLMRRTTRMMTTNARVPTMTPGFPQREDHHCPTVGHVEGVVEGNSDQSPLDMYNAVVCTTSLRSIS